MFLHISIFFPLIRLGKLFIEMRNFFFSQLAFWSNGMIFKVVPCFLLTISIAALLKIIADVSHRRRSLAQVSSFFFLDFRVFFLMSAIKSIVELSLLVIFRESIATYLLIRCIETSEHLSFSSLVNFQVFECINH